MFLQIQFESEIPIYQQIKDQIIKGIATGELMPGEALPSVRQLASDIGINFHTVSKVYTQLKQEGWVIIHRKSGVVVNTDLRISTTPEYMTSLNEALTVLSAEAFLRGVTEEVFIKLLRDNYKAFKRFNHKGGKE